jgi:hypothetical protein
VAHFTAIAGSIAPSLQDTLTVSGAAADLTDATVTLRLQHASTAEVVEFEMDASAGEGVILRNWESGDLDLTPGTWWGQYIVDRGVSGVEIWPTPSDGQACSDVWGRGGLEFHICRAIPAP